MFSIAKNLTLTDGYCTQYTVQDICGATRFRAMMDSHVWRAWSWKGKQINKGILFSEELISSVAATRTVRGARLRRGSVISPRALSKAVGIRI